MKVLIPTDFSKSARVAFDYAYQLYKEFDNPEFVLLNSFEMPAAGSAGGVMMNLEEAMSKESINDLKLEVQALQAKYKNINITSVSRYGTLENSVARTGNEYGIDVVVMGTHGASGLKRALMGSNTEKVIENVHVPVISVPRYWEFRPIKTIVYATDLKRIENTDAINNICKMAKYFDTTLHIVYVAEDASAIDLENEVSKLPLNECLKKMKKDFKVIESDNIADGIDEYVREIDADLVVLIPKAASFWQKIFKRSVTGQMAFQSKVPMLSIKDI